MVLAELWHRKLSTLLGVVAVLIASALLIVSGVSARAVDDATRQIQRDIGQNIIIIPVHSAVDRFHTLGYAEGTMPESAVERLESQGHINRFLGRLTRPVTLTLPDGRTESVLISGVTEERFGTGEGGGKPVFTRKRELIPAGAVHVGAAIAERLRLKVDDTITITGLHADGSAVEAGEFFVDEVMPASAADGTLDDAVVFAALADVQRLCGVPGQISEIRALECVECLVDPAEYQKSLAAVVTGVVPEGRVIRLDAAADARQGQRRLTFAFINAAGWVTLAIAGAWIATLAAMNTAARRDEVGVLRALGHGSASVAVLFLGRSLAVAMIGAVLGVATGWLFASAFGPGLLDVQPKSITLPASSAAGAVLASVACAVVASLVPAWLGASRDPVALLREQ